MKPYYVAAVGLMALLVFGTVDAIQTLELLGPQRAVAQAPAPSPAPAPVVPAATEVTAKLEGPLKAPAAGKPFVVYYEVTDKAADGTATKITWENSYPKDAMPPLRGRDESGKPMLVFLDTVRGDYEFNVAVQYPAPGLDPFAKDRLIVKVGGGTPAPTPPDDKPKPPVVPKPVVVAPSQEAQAVLAPLKTLTLAAGNAKAAQLGSIWNDFNAVCKSGALPATTGDFQSALVAFINAAATQEGLAGAFPGHSAALDAAMKSFLGAQDMALDKAKALDFINGLVWSCYP